MTASMNTNPSANPANAGLARRRGILILLGVLFLGPFFAAYVFYFYFPDWHPQARVNHGRLIDPPRPLPSLHFTDAAGKTADETLLQGKWTLLYLGTSSCDDACTQRLYIVRQVHTRLNSDRDRVQRAYVAPDSASLATVSAALGAIHPGLLWLADDDAPGARLTDFLHPEDPQAIYLIDPHGNWILVYPADPSQEFQPLDLYQDLKHVLGLSQIG